MALQSVIGNQSNYFHSYQTWFCFIAVMFWNDREIRRGIYFGFGRPNARQIPAWPGRPTAAADTVLIDWHTT